MEMSAPQQKEDYMSVLHYCWKRFTFYYLLLNSFHLSVCHLEPLCFFYYLLLHHLIHFYCTFYGCSVSTKTASGENVSECHFFSSVHWELKRSFIQLQYAWEKQAALDSKIYLLMVTRNHAAVATALNMP